MGQSAVQELARILRGMRARGLRSVWLSDTNISGLSAQLGRYSSAAHPNPVLAEQPKMQSIPAAAARQTQPAFSSMPASPPPMPAPPPKTPSQVAPPDLGPKIAAMDEGQLTKAIEECNYCQYGNSCKHRAVYAGAPKPKILFVGDFPSAAEAEGGSPFASQSGQMLYKMGTAMGLAWENAPQGKGVGLLNILKCRPDTMMPSPDALAVCGLYARRQIELAEPAALVLMGALAVKILCPTENRSFSQIEGKLLDCRGIISIPIKHPNMIMRFVNQQTLFFEERKKAWNSLQRLMQMVF